MLPSDKIAFLGVRGAYSELAALAVFPERETLACAAFEDVFEAVREGAAAYGIIPIENSTAGRVADIHHLLPDSGLYIVGEHFAPVRHCLIGLPGADPGALKAVLSHPQALAQCRGRLRDMGLTPEAFGNTAGAAAEIARRGDPTLAALGSRLAAEINELSVLLEDAQDYDHNTTRFVVVAREKIEPPPDVKVMTSFIFRVRNVPAALYKALGGFATNGVNMTKLESYTLEGSFAATQFYAEVAGRPGARPFDLALEELGFFADEVRLLGTYPADAFRERVRS
jgi:prephenate dehydratase